MVPHAVNTCRCLQKIETRKTAAAKKREQVSILRIVLEATFRGSHCSLSVIEEMNLQHHHTDSPEFEDGSEVIELRIVIKATCGVRRAASRRRHLRSMKLTVNETYGQPWGAWLFLQTCTGSKRGVASLQYCRLIELERFSLRRTWKHKQEKQTKSDVSTKQKNGSLGEEYASTSQDTSKNNPYYNRLYYNSSYSYSSIHTSVRIGRRRVGINYTPLLSVSAVADSTLWPVVSRAPQSLSLRLDWHWMWLWLLGTDVAWPHHLSLLSRTCCTLADGWAREPPAGRRWHWEMCLRDVVDK